MVSGRGNVFPPLVPSLLWVLRGQVCSLRADGLLLVLFAHNSRAGLAVEGEMGDTRATPLLPTDILFLFYVLFISSTWILGKHMICLEVKTRQPCLKVALFLQIFSNLS